MFLCMQCPGSACNVWAVHVGSLSMGTGWSLWSCQYFALIRAIDLERQKNRLLKVCYVPTTSAGLPRLLFSFLFMQPLAVLIKQTRQAVRAIKQSIYLDVYDSSTFIKCLFVTWNQKCREKIWVFWWTILGTLEFLLWGISYREFVTFLGL
jgi:hypothetical protein